MTTAWLLDFDGTVSPTDVGAALIGRFASGNEAEASEALRRWMSGTLGHRELTELECRRVAATREQALEFARGFAVDPDFVPFAHRVLACGEPLLVVSEGFDFYIAELLDWCRRERIPARPFPGFAGLSAALAA